jgi:hypothetical protein
MITRQKYETRDRMQHLICVSVPAGFDTLLEVSQLPVVSC